MKIRLIFFVLLFILSLDTVFCAGCHNIIDLSNKNCYNDVITFNHDNWRSGHACTTNNGELIVEFSLNDGESSKRLFYGLNKNGRYYFPGEPVYKQINSMTCQDCDSNNYRGRFESRNLLVNVGSETKQYLFSMSSYYSLVELIDFENGFNYLTWNMSKFFSLTRPIFSYEFSLFEIGTSKTYISAFIESAGFMQDPDDNNKLKEYSNSVTIKKFKLKSFSNSNYKEISTPVTISNTYNGRVVSAFRLHNSQKIALLYIKPRDNTDNKGGNYKIKIYNEAFSEHKTCSIYDNVENLWVGYGIFVKGISVKGDYAALAFFHDGDYSKNSLVFKFVEYNSGKDDCFNYIYEYKFTSDQFRPDIQSNGLYRLSDDRIVLFSTKDYNSIEYGSLYMQIFDFYNNFKKVKIRRYIFSYPGKRFAKEMEASLYNNYIVFSSTLSNSNQNKTFAILMIFGFANGTDHEIDISPYLMDTGYYNSENNLYKYLIGNMSIDNNIFSYEKIEKIRLKSICNELKLFYGKYGVSQGESVPIDGEFDADHILLQNKDIIKYENQLYMLEYQFMVKEPNIATLYQSANTTYVLEKETTQEQNYYTPKTLYGRVNKLFFKLCHKFCIDCVEYGRTNNNNDQRCKTCKNQYTYDYLANMNRFTGNCVPSNYMYDAENKTLKTCNSDNYKYYFNISESKKKYCFMYKYPCPDDYHYLNETSHECLDYTPPAPTTIATTLPAPVITEKPTEKPTTIITDKPTTIITDKPTTIITDKPTTIVTDKPTTIITDKPTTIITDKPTTIITDKPTTIVTDKPTTIITDKPTTILTDKPTTIITEKPSTIITESPAKKPSTIIIENTTENPKETLAPSTIIEDKCVDGSLLNNTCRNLTNQDLYEGIKEEVLSRFPPNGKSVILPGKQGYNFQVTTAKNEIISANSPSSETLIDLGDCEKKLREANGITGNLSLIIYKFYKEGEIVRENDMQFEVYDPYTHKQLNLSVCNSINVYVPLNLSQDHNVYQNILDQGYDPFDLGDKFYREICTQYTSENGTDVLLDAREEYYYSPIVNETSCQGNCRYSAYSLDTKYLICECDVNTDGIVTLNIKHLDEKNVAYSFYSSLKLSNYKVVICYNLVFNFKVFCHNYGSIISAIFLGLYIASMIYYSFRTIHPLKVEISKFLFEVGEGEGNNNSPSMETKKFSFQRNTSKKKSKKNNKNDNKALPPKRATTNAKKGTTRTKATKITANSSSESDKLKGLQSKNIKNKNKNNDILINPYSSKILIGKQEKSGVSLISKPKKFEIKEKGGNKDKDKDKDKEEEEILDPDLLDNYEFNNLEYEQACKYDNRSFCRTYISVLMREELALFTFFSCHDYNLFYVKIARFLVLACTNMTMTALFFFHKTMYKKQDIEENWSFVQKLPQMLFVLISSHIIEVYLCYLSMTDVSIYEIKSLSKKPNNGKKVIDIIDCMKTKLIIFFVSTFILFLAFWYFISAFCAVYQNTQYIFIRDSAISFVSSLLDPFITYGLTMILRRLSLSACCKNKAKCCYKLSDIIPIF